MTPEQKDAAVKGDTVYHALNTARIEADRLFAEAEVVEKICRKVGLRWNPDTYQFELKRN